MKRHALNSIIIRRLTLGVALAALGPVLSCKSVGRVGDGSSVRSVSPLPTDPELREAAIALNTIGATTPYLDGASRCGGACHIQAWHGVIDVEKVKRWGQRMQDMNTCFTGVDAVAGLSVQVKAQRKIKCFLVDPADPDAGYETAKLGIYRTGAKTAFFEQMFKDAYNTDADRTLYKARYDDFAAKANMPSNAPLAQEDLDKIWPWVLKGMKRMDEVFGKVADPQAIPCEDKVSDDLKTHIKDLSSESGFTKSWSFKNMTSEKVSMFGCTTKMPAMDDTMTEDKIRDAMLSVPLECFGQKAPTGQALFPLVHTMDATRGWAERYTPEGKPLDQRMRILRVLNFNSTYWARSSADGRFFASGLERDPNHVLPNGTKGFIVDLLDTNRPQIAVSGPYDPGFFPDNKGFTFMTGSDGAFFCNQELLKDPGTKTIDFVAEVGKPTPLCGRERSLGVYQHVGSSPSGGSYVVVRSNDYENDDGANSVHSDPIVTKFAKATSVVEVWPMKESGRAFEVQPVIPITVPFEGDYTIFPSTSFLTSRIAAPIPGSTTSYGQQGYRIRKYDTATKSTQEMATVCLRGGKASISHNERILATHHYTDQFDFQNLGYGQADPAFQGMIKDSSNIWIYDMYTQRKTRLTRMGKGQYALYPHFRSDGWLYFLVRDNNTKTEYIVGTDAAIRFQKGVSFN